MITHCASALTDSTTSGPLLGFTTQGSSGVWGVHELSLTSTDLQAIRTAVIGLPLPGYDAVDRLGYDFLTKSRWMYSYLVQVGESAINNFSIARDGVGFRVFLDDGLRITGEWRSFSTINHAVAAIGKHVEDASRLAGGASSPSTDRLAARSMGGFGFRA